MPWRLRLRDLVDSAPFQRTIVTLIVVNAVALGLETSPQVTDQLGDLLRIVDHTALVAFVVELIARLIAFGPRFFREPWNCFDFAIVAVSLTPATAGLSVLRALRILRALRLVSAVPGMRRVVAGLLAAIPAMTSIILLLGLVLYVAAVLATELFADSAPESFGDLGTSLFTLFQVMTGEAWPDIAARVLPMHPWAWIFFVIYILVSTFVMLNLFTAVVVSAMEPERNEQSAADQDLLAEVRALRADIATLRAQNGPGTLPPGSDPAGGETVSLSRS